MLFYFFIVVLTFNFLLFQGELVLMYGIIPEKNKKIVFEKVVMQSMENLVSEGDVSLFSYILNIPAFLYFLAK